MPLFDAPFWRAACAGVAGMKELAFLDDLEDEAGEGAVDVEASLRKT